MFYIYKFLTKKTFSHNFIVNLQMYGSFVKKKNMVSNFRTVRDSGVVSANGTGKSHLQMLYDLRFQCPKNVLCGYLNLIV